MDSGAQELLEIFIITYNRSTHLDNTLRQLVGCPFTKFPITILDNCSEDNTYDIFLNYQSQFPNLSYTKNKINIGADANVLRAAELSDGKYTWILCDDDNYDFSTCDDVLAELTKGEVAAIMVGCTDILTWPDGSLCGTPIDLIRNDFCYFGVPSFVPGGIFRTKLFQDQIRLSYSNIINLFPAMTYYIKLFNEKNKIYVAKNKIVDAAANAPYHYSFLRVMSGLLNTFHLIDDVYARRKAFYTIYLKPPYFTIYSHALMWQKAGGNFSFTTKWRYFKILNWEGKIIFLIAYLAAPIANRVKVPKSVLRELKKYRL